MRSYLMRDEFGQVLEAMAQGAVTVTSKGTSTAEVAGDAGLLVDPRDDEDLVDALERALDDEARVRARWEEYGLGDL